MKRILFLTAFILFSLIETSYAWWSIEFLGRSTHFDISDKAIVSLSPTDYPDMQYVRFGQYVRDNTSGVENDKNEKQ